MLDLIAAFLCGLIALSCFTIYSTSGPDKRVWFNLPPFVRFGLVLVGMSVAIRSVNFLSLWHGDLGRAGHANWESVFAAAALAYLMIAVVVSALARTYPPRIWDRIKKMHFTASCAPQTGPPALYALFSKRAAERFASTPSRGQPGGVDQSKS